MVQRLKQSSINSTKTDTTGIARYGTETEAVTNGTKTETVTNGTKTETETGGTKTETVI